jgi:UDP-N-acetylmuramate: L-alanyl-gamma-D-glutamyl-meso-diaminopimelate ligase
MPAREEIPPVRNVHLIAICGVAMAALAAMLRQRGYHVTGSDENVYPPMSTLLERWRIPIRGGFRAENLALEGGGRPDLVVVGNKVTRDNPEVQALLASGIRYVSMSQALRDLFLTGKRSLVVAGTHGKTTSTAMLGWVLEQAGLDPSVLVGGDAKDFGGNFKLGAGEYFVIEGDEYDTAFFDKGPKFLHYEPQAVLLTAVEFDHADIYRDLDHVKAAFRRLLEILPRGAPVVVAADFPHALAVVKNQDVRVETFGLVDGARWQAKQVRAGDAGTVFEICFAGKLECTATTRLLGAINARNALGVYVLGRALGVAEESLLRGLASFSGVARRQELVGDFRGMTLIDDFAHHPTAVAGTIAAVRQQYPGRRLWAVFEPRSNTSRRKVFQQQYIDAFSGADRVIIGGVFSKPTDLVGEDEIFSPEQLARDLNRRGVEARAFPEVGVIVAALLRNARPGDVVVMMSNGSFGGLRDELVTALGSPEPVRGNR